jgi:hypothetical protein
VVHESISRWENGVLPVSSPVDRLMRTMVALTTSGKKFPVETLSHTEGDAGPLKLVVTVDSKGSWRCAAWEVRHDGRARGLEGRSDFLTALRPLSETHDAET